MTPNLPTSEGLQIGKYQKEGSLFLVVNSNPSKQFVKNVKSNFKKICLDSECTNINQMLQFTHCFNFFASFELKSYAISNAFKYPNSATLGGMLQNKREPHIFLPGGFIYAACHPNVASLHLSLSALQGKKLRWPT